MNTFVKTLPPSIQKRNFNDIIFHIYSNNGFLFIVATEFTEVDEKAFDFLKCIQERYIALHLDESDHFSKGSLSQKFKTELSTIMNQYNTNKKIWVTQQSMQSLNQIKNQVDEVTEIMRDNVDTVLKESWVGLGYFLSLFKGLRGDLTPTEM